jgi:hypothetical protein
VTKEAVRMAEAILDLDDATACLSQLVERAAGGEEIIIAKAGRPLHARQLGRFLEFFRALR